MTNKHLLELGRRLAIAALCIGGAGLAEALSLAVHRGAITGVLGLEIQGKSYDVSFVDGTFNSVYPAKLSGYGPLAEDVAHALLSASDGGKLLADLNERQDSRLRGCASGTSCTILIPEHSIGAAPVAKTTHARELIFSNGRFRSVTPKLWPFDASTDTQYMPDMLYAIIEPSR